MTDAPKPFKSKVETYEFGGKVVTLTSLPPDQRRHGGVAMRSKWKIEIDGVLRAYAFFPNGYGGKWRVYSLMAHGYYGHPERAVRPWEHDETGYNEGWEGLMAELKPVGVISVYPEHSSKAGEPISLNSDGSIRQSSRNEWEGRPAIAAGIVHVPFTDLPTKDVVLTEYENEAERIVERKRRDAEREAQYAREREEAAEAARVAAEKAEAERKETLEGLTSIRQSWGTHLSNFEQSALAAAIEKFGGTA
jgi:hypothetical protein